MVSLGTGFIKYIFCFRGSEVKFNLDIVSSSSDIIVVRNIICVIIWECAIPNCFDSPSTLLMLYVIFFILIRACFQDFIPLKIFFRCGGYWFFILEFCHPTNKKNPKVFWSVADFVHLKHEEWNLHFSNIASQNLTEFIFLKYTCKFFLFSI